MGLASIAGSLEQWRVVKSILYPPTVTHIIPYQFQFEKIIKQGGSPNEL